MYIYTHTCIYIPLTARYCVSLVTLHVCVYICMCIYIYIYIYLYIYMYIYIHIHIYILLTARYCVSLVTLHVCIYIYIHTYICIFICVYIYIYSCIYNIHTSCAKHLWGNSPVASEDKGLACCDLSHSVPWAIVQLIQVHANTLHHTAPHWLKFMKTHCNTLHHTVAVCWSSCSWFSSWKFACSNRQISKILEGTPLVDFWPGSPDAHMIPWLGLLTLAGVPGQCLRSNVHTRAHTGDAQFATALKTLQQDCNHNAATSDIVAILFSSNYVATVIQ